MQASIFGYLSQARIKWEGCSRKGIRHKNGEDDNAGSLINPDGVAPSRMVGVSASVIFPCTIKSRRFLLAPAHLGSPGKRAVIRLYMCVVLLDTVSKLVILCRGGLSQILITNAFCDLH